MNDMIDLLVVLDRSGSMQDKRLDHEGGLKSFIADQRTLDGDVRLTFAQFDDVYELICDRVPLADVDDAKVVLIPRGSTALLDGVGKALAHLQAAQVAEPSSQTIVMVITDGGENASSEWTRERVKDAVAAAEKKNWTFLFLGANVDAFGEARNLGVSTGTAANYSTVVPDSVQAAYRVASNKTLTNRAIRASGGSVAAASATMMFTAEDAGFIQSGTVTASGIDTSVVDDVLASTKIDKQEQE